MEGPKKYRYTGDFKKIFYSAKEVAEILKTDVKLVRKIVKNRYRKVGSFFEIPITDLEKIKSLIK